MHAFLPRWMFLLVPASCATAQVFSATLDRREFSYTNTRVCPTSQFTSGSGVISGTTAPIIDPGCSLQGFSGSLRFEDPASFRVEASSLSATTAQLASATSYSATLSGTATLRTDPADPNRPREPLDAKVNLTLEGATNSAPACPAAQDLKTITMAGASATVSARVTCRPVTLQVTTAPRSVNGRTEFVATLRATAVVDLRHPSGRGGLYTLTVRSFYRFVEEKDELTIEGAVPAPTTVLEPGFPYDSFRATVRYNLRTRSQATLALQLVSLDGTVIAASAPRPVTTGAGAIQGLQLQPFQLTDRDLTLRLQAVLSTPPPILTSNLLEYTVVVVRLDSTEVVQVVQDPGNRVPLIADKPTAARVFVVVGGKNAKPVEKVTAVLKGKRDGSDLPGSPLAPYNGSITVPLFPERDNAAHSLNFILPPSWNEAGNLELTTEVKIEGSTNQQANTTATGQFRFSQLASWPLPFVVGYLPVCYWPRSIPAQLCPDAATIAAADSLLIKMFPVAPKNMRYEEIQTPIPPWFEEIRLSNQRRFVKWLRSMYDFLDPGATRYDQLVGWLPAIPPPEDNPNDRPSLGESDPRWLSTRSGGRVSYVQDYATSDWLDKHHTLAHEIAHNLGRRHTNASGCGDSDPDTDWPDPASGRTGHAGFDPLARELKPSTKYDLMSYCSPASEIWISKFTYEKLIGSELRPSLSKSPRTQAEAPVDYLIVRGAVSRDGSMGRLDPTFRISGPGPTQPVSTSGNYCLRFTAPDGSASDACFQVSFEDHRRSVLFDEEDFSLSAVLPAGTTRIALLKGEAELAALAASPSRPEVSITSPAANDRWEGGPQTITWSASDADSDTLTYAVFYSADGGGTWVPMHFDLTQPAFTFDPAFIHGGKQVHFRILASDGFHTSSAEVGPVEVVQSPRLAVTPDAADLRLALPGQVSERTVMLSNTGSGPLTVRSIVSEDPVFQVAAERAMPLVIRAGASRQMTVRFSPAVVGDRSTALLIETNEPDRPVVRVPLQGRGIAVAIPDMEVTPAVLDFGAIAVGQTKELALVIRNWGPGALTVSGVTGLTAPFALAVPSSAFSLPAGAERAIVIRYQPGAAGAQSATLRISSNDPSRGVLSVTVKGEAKPDGS